MRFPPQLRPGDPIALVAPSGAFDPVAARAGIAWLRTRYEVRHRPALLVRAPSGFLAAADRLRTAELQWALDADVAAVVALRGGYGLSRIVGALDWGFARARPKWLVGFSDFTVLHAEAWRRGLATAHASMVCALARASDSARDSWIAALEQPRAPREWSGLTCVCAGQEEGTLVGGNLAMLHASAAAGRLTLPRRAVLLIEDVGERPYRVDRMLTNLLDGGHLRQVSAVIVGDFTNCDPGPDGRTVEEVVRERVRQLGVAAVSGFPAGHGGRNDTVILGQKVSVVARRRGSSVQGRR